MVRPLQTTIIVNTTDSPEDMRYLVMEFINRLAAYSETPFNLRMYGPDGRMTDEWAGNAPGQEDDQ